MTRTIGISGGVASGKSTVARILGGLGARVIDADIIGHEVLKRADVREKIVSKWGEGVLDETGEMDRDKLGGIVFSDETRLKELEAVVHPIILHLIRDKVQAAADARERVIVLDAALLHESGLDAICDAVIFVEADEASRAARAADRGWTDEGRAARERQQMDVGEKRERADWVVNNSGSVEELEGQIKAIWQQILKHNGWF